MDAIEGLVQNLVSTNYEDIPRAAITTTKMEVLDTLGVLIAGGKAPGCGAVVKVVTDWGGKPESTILVYGGKVPSYAAALVNSVIARALDYDTTIPGGLHPGASSVPTALAVAEMRGNVTGKELLTALVLGEDLAVRLHFAIPGTRFERNGICLVFGTAAITGRLLGLGTKEMRDALGIALVQASGSFQTNLDGALAVRLSQGLTSQAGVQSAIWAKHGITGAQNIIDGKLGFLNTFADEAIKADALTRDLGQTFAGAANTSFKPYPSGNLVNAATWLTLQLVTQHDITPDQVAEIKLGMTPFAYEKVGTPFTIRDNPQVDAQFSVRYAVANALVRRDSQLEHFTDSSVRLPQVLSVVTKVHPEIDQHWIEKDIDPGAATVEIRLNDGRKYLLSLEHPKGRPQNPLTVAEIKQKFRRCVAYAGWLPKRGEEIISTIDRLAEIRDVTHLINLLIPA